MTTLPVKQLGDITECPICAELFTDPRVLPCIHTFCLKCLEKCAEDKIAGGRLACPMCRKEFVIPGGGMADLPRNYFIGKLLEVRKLARALSLNQTPCDLCSADEGKDEDESVTAAVAHCFDCSQNMCPSCISYHKRFRPTTSHRTGQLGEQQSVSDLLLKLPEIHCDQHPDKVLKVFCF